MTRYLKLAGIAVLALAMLAPAASAQRVFVGARVGPRFGPRYVGPRGFVGPRVFVGPVFYPGWYGWGYSGLGWYEPYGYVPAPDAGKVKFETKAKNAQIYVDGAYAGTVDQLGTFPLKTGTHDLELRDASGQSIYSEHVNIIAGKTLKIKI